MLSVGGGQDGWAGFQSGNLSDPDAVKGSEKTFSLVWPDKNTARSVNEVTLTLFVANSPFYPLQRRRCGRCWRTAARLRSPCTAPVRTGRTSQGSTTAPRPSSCGPSCRGRSSASRKWFTAARSPVSLTPKVGTRSVCIVLPGVWEGYLRPGIECVKRVKIYVSGNIWGARWNLQEGDGDVNIGIFQQPVQVLCCGRV